MQQTLHLQLLPSVRDFKGVDISRHFSMYALEGGTGNLGWKHEGQDFHKDAAELQDKIVPQHDHRLNAEHIGGRHYGEASCRDFKESVLAAMPHRCRKGFTRGLQGIQQVYNRS